MLGPFGSTGSYAYNITGVVIGVLKARNYALFLNHKPLNGEVHFDVFSETVPGRKWGQFHCNVPDDSGSGSEPSPVLGGDSEPAWDPHYATKVSTSGDESGHGGDSNHCLLLALLGFKPDSLEPMLL